MKVKACRNCAWSEPENNSEWNLVCMHPEVNKGDVWYLGSALSNGSNCREARKQIWPFGACGKRGALYEEKNHVD